MAGSGIRLEPGHVLDERYLLEQVIGQGGMGTVFAARHLELDERVAVKVLQSESEFVTMEDEHLERFLREARLSAKLKNEHVVRVIDVARGKHGAPPYIVMELLDGCDLGDLVSARGRLPVPEAVGYILQACEALAEAHALGIVHRDLKATNLHLSQRSDGTNIVKVLDFGICKVHDESTDAHLTATASVFGSPAYMSPEQIRSSKHVDTRTDVWAMACVLYELVTAQLPFMGTNPAEMLSSITSMPHIPLRKFAPDVPDGLELVIRGAFVKDREQRTPSIAAFAAALAPFGDANSAALVATIQRIAARPRVLDRSQPAVLQSGAAPIIDAALIAPGVVIADTIRAAPPAIGPGSEPVAIAPPPFSAPARQDAVSRTDRALVVAPPATPEKKSILLPLLAGFGVACALVATIVVVLLVRTKAVPPASGPANVVGAEAPPMPVPVPPSLPAAVPSETAMTTSAPVVELPASASSGAPNPLARPPKPRPAHPSASPKPNGTIDFSQRQ